MTKDPINADCQDMKRLQCVNGGVGEIDCKTASISANGLQFQFPTIARLTAKES